MRQLPILLIVFSLFITSCEEDPEVMNFAPGIVDGIPNSESPCDVPTNLRMSNLTEKSAEIYWSVNDQIDNVAPINWEVKIHKSSDNNTPPIIFPAGTWEFKIQDLTAFTSYEVSVRSKCNNGSVSTWSKKILFTTLAK